MRVALRVAETEIQVVYALSTRHLGVECLVLLYTACIRNQGLANDGTILRVDAERQFASACRGSADAELLGTMEKVYTTQFDEFSVVDIEDVHVAFASRFGHISHHARVLDTHLALFSP